MSRTLTISDDLYARLQATARQRGLESVEQLLDAWQTNGDSDYRRINAVNQVNALRNQLFAKYGPMPDSAELVREDRER